MDYGVSLVHYGVSSQVKLSSGTHEFSGMLNPKQFLSCLTFYHTFRLCRDQASYTESTKMRPHLPRSTRPSAQSLFDASNILSVFLQAGVHLITTEIGIRFGRNLEAAAGQPTRPRVIVRPAASQSSKMSVLLGALAKSKSTTQLVESDEETKNFLGQPKFIPNYETNIVCK